MNFREIPIRKLAPYWPLNDDDQRTYVEHLEHRIELNAAVMADIQQGNGRAANPAVSFELHPYLEKYEGRMPDSPICYIIGTAPPSNYLRTSLENSGRLTSARPLLVNGKAIKGRPILDFYHGNENSLWHFLGVSPLTINGICEFLNNRKIKYVDVVKSWGRKDITSPEDAGLTDILPNIPLFEELWDRPDETILWFTSAGIALSGGLKFHRKRRAPYKKHFKEQRQIDEYGLVICHDADLSPFNLFLRTWQELGATIKVRKTPGDDWVLLNDFLYPECTRLHQLLIQFDQFAGSPKKIFSILTGPSPSRNANRGLGNSTCYARWKSKFPNKPQSTDIFRRDIYSAFLNIIEGKRVQP